MLPPVTIKHFQNFQKADNKAHFETPKYVSRTQLRIIKHKKKSIGPHTGSAIAAPFGGQGWTIKPTWICSKFEKITRLMGRTGGTTST